MCSKTMCPSVNAELDLNAVIDVGSNSVRLLLSRNGVTVFKGVKVTKLAQGVLATSMLNDVAIDRTVSAIKEFCDYANEQGANNIFIFATAGVRQAKNGNVFVDKVKEVCGITVDVVSGGIEAKIGAIGALDGADGGLIDIGGASTEITVIKDKKTIYSKSINIICPAPGLEPSRLGKFLVE